VAYRSDNDQTLIEAAKTSAKILDKKNISELIPTPKSPDCAPSTSSKVVPDITAKPDIDTCEGYVIHAETDFNSKARLEQMIRDLNSDSAVKKNLNKRNICKELTEVQFFKILDSTELPN
jgi:hypothetical protein